MGEITETIELTEKQSQICNMIKTNEYQTQLTDELLNSLKEEVRTDLLDILNNVEFVKRLIDPNRPRACDLKKDDSGRIIVDICNPHILENMNYFRQAAIHFQKYGCYTKLMPNPNPQSEYGQWLRREVLRCWNGMVRESDGEWITGDMYFYLNYFPIIQTKMKKGSKVGERVIDFPEVWEGVYWRFHYWHQARYGGIYDNFTGAKHCVEIASRGKSHPYSQDVLTPHGFTKWSEIKVGSKLFGSDGGITTVTDIPFDDEIEVYKISLKDGREVFSSKEHLWNVHKHGWKNDKIETKSLEEILLDYKKPRKITERNPSGFEYVYSIPSNKAIEFESKSVFIDPYTMGLLLGDGTFRHPEYINTVAFTAHKDDMEIYRNHIPYKINTGKTKFGHSISIDGVSDYLKSVGLFMQKSDGKFIPQEYKYNSKEVRLELLKGLMDTDGELSNGRPTYSSVSEQLIKDVAFIARSLGYNCNYTKQKAGYKKDGVYIKCQDCYCLWIYTNDKIFKLPRKLSLLAEYTKGYSKSKRDKTRIINIEFSHIEKSKCVTVDNESHSYLIGDFVQTHNSKSYSFGSKLVKNFVVGENATARSKVKSLVAAYQKEYLIKDGTLNKFIDGITHCAKYTQFPSKRLKASLSDLNWRAGYLDQDTGLEMGTLNEVLGVAIKDDSDKLRGKRSSAMLFEEFGSFPKFLDVWQTSIPNVQEGDVAFGQAIACGTGGSEGSDFSGALEMINYPDGYNVYSLPNIYDKGATGKKKTIFFFPGYVNAKGYYNEDGVSDVIGALISEIEYRINLKYNSSDPLQLTRRKAETAFTIQDAIMKRDGSLYPTDKLNDVINEINLNPKYTDDFWIGRLKISKEGIVEYKPDNDLKYITEFPHKDNKIEGACCIFQMPVKDSSGKVPWGRYIAGCDPYDDDASNTLSLMSLFILDLWTDEIVFEYTGRPMFAEDAYENIRLALLMYNAEMNYENNKKGIFKHFSQHNSLYLMSDTLEFLKDKDMAKPGQYGNKAKGTPNYGNGEKAIAPYARRCIRDYLLKSTKTNIVKEVNGEIVQEEVSVFNYHKIPSKALLQELAMWNNDGNYDRHDALAMLMLLREDKMRLYGVTSPRDAQANRDVNYPGNDDFFEKNYNRRANKDKDGILTFG